MLFLSLEYQLILIVALVFSSYLFINALFMRHQSIGLKAFGLTFILPLMLTLAAFLTATYHKSSASAFLILGHLFLALLCTLVVLFPENTKTVKLFYILPFILLITAFLSEDPPYMTPCLTDSASLIWVWFWLTLPSSSIASFKGKNKRFLSTSGFL